MSLETDIQTAYEEQEALETAACDLIPLQMTLLHYLQREIITNHLLRVEPDWPWAKQPTRP